MLPFVVVQINVCASDKSTVTTLPLYSKIPTLSEYVLSFVCPCTSNVEVGCVLLIPTEPIPA